VVVLTTNVDFIVFSSFKTRQALICEQFEWIHQIFLICEIFVRKISPKKKTPLFPRNGRYRYRLFLFSGGEIGMVRSRFNQNGTGFFFEVEKICVKKSKKKICTRPIQTYRYLQPNTHVFMGGVFARLGKACERGFFGKLIEKRITLGPSDLFALENLPP